MPLLHDINTLQCPECDRARTGGGAGTENLARRGVRYYEEIRAIIICNVVTYTNISCQPPPLPPTRAQWWPVGERAANESPVFLYFHQSPLSADQGEIEDFEILKYETCENQH